MGLNGVIHREEPVLIPLDTALLNLDIKATHERPVAARLDDQRAVRLGRHVQPVVRMAADDDVKTKDALRKTDVLRIAQMRQHNDQVGTLGAQSGRFRAGLINAVGKAQACGKVRRHRLVQNGGGKADHAHAQAARLADQRGLERMAVLVLVPAVGCQHGIGQLPRQFRQVIRTPGKIPMCGHR